MITQDKIRNIAIIAHVDHGKTTLVDHLLKQAHTFAAHQVEMTQNTIMDSQDLERERGVTILAKNTAVHWHEYKINILDTPGHADFAGEVERVLSMADGCVLLVDAAEGVLSQTKYVLSLAFKNHLKPIVVINKVDRKDQRAAEVLEEINDLFLELAQHESHLDFPVLYAIGRQGIAGYQTLTLTDQAMEITDSKDLTPLFETIVSKIPSPTGDATAPLQLQVTTLDYDSHKGRYVIGKIAQGKIAQGIALRLMLEETAKGQGRVEYLYTFKGLERQEVTEAFAGDIVAVTGFPQAQIGDTLTPMDYPHGLPAVEIVEPTMKVQFSVSTSPLVGKDGDYSTSRQIGERLRRELETNVSLRINNGQSGDSFIVSGRGELHLSILIETMRREGFEFSVSRPEVIFKEINGLTSEPWEKVMIEVPEEYSGTVITMMGKRKAEMAQMINLKSGVRLEYKIATRHLIGFRNELLTQTSGLGILHSQLLGYEPKGHDLAFERNGAIVSSESGQALAYSLNNLQDRGVSFVHPAEEVYMGMIVGQNTRKEDMVMNVCKGKKLTNMRAAAGDATIKLTPPIKMSLEQCLTWLGPDELLEVTPHHLRLRKRNLAVKR